MAWLMIPAAFVVLLVFLVTVPIRLHVSYSDSVTLSVSVLLIRIPILPWPKKKIKPSDFTWKRHQKRLQRAAAQAEKKRLKELERAKKKTKTAKDKSKKKKLPAIETEVKDPTTLISILISVVKGIIEKFFGLLHVDAVRLRIRVGGPDATTTAMTYGIVAQGVAFLMELIAQKTRFRRVKNEYISVVPDFLSETTTADIALVFSIRLWYFINIAITFLFRFVKEFFKEKIRRESELT